MGAVDPERTFDVPRDALDGKSASFAVAARDEAARFGVPVRLSLETASPCPSRYSRRHRLAQLRASAFSLSMQGLWMFEISLSSC